MDLNIVHKSFSTEDDDIEKIEPQELLDDSWFFGNLLDRKTKMLRSLSDPCTSSEKSYEETYESIKKLPLPEGFGLSSSTTRPNLMRASSQQTPSSKGRNKSKKKTPSNKLLRAPSLPISLGTEHLQDEEIEFSMGKLIRQASMNNSNILPPRKHTPKIVTPSNSSITKQRSLRKQESIKLETKSLNDIEYEELKGFKDLEVGFDEKELSPNVINAIPGLQENRRIVNDDDDDEEHMRRRTYLGSSSAPPVPKWGGKKSRDDMKTQIKFWARAVASNVRQEC